MLHKICRKKISLLWYAVVTMRSDVNGLSVRNKVNGPRQAPCGKKNRSTTSRDLNVSL